MDSSLKAIILAGGLGTRLRSVVSDVPKCMAPVAGRPFLEHILDQLASQNFSHICLSIGYKSEFIEKHFGCEYKGIKISYHKEQQPLGTGGAIRASASYLQGTNIITKDQPLFILNGDTFLEVNYKDMFSRFTSDVDMLLATKFMDPADRYGLLEINNNMVSVFKEKSPNSKGFINSGTYLIRPKLFDAFGIFNNSDKDASFSWETDFLQKNISNLKIKSFKTEGLFIDIGIPEDYQKAQQIF